MISVKEIQVCHCQPDENCGQNCENRAMFYECTAGHCPCTNNCTNQRIKKWRSILVSRFITSENGYGLKALETIGKDTMVIEYVGEVITEEEYMSRVTTKYENSKNFYCIQLQGNYVVDAHEKGNFSRFINHSCSPNCHIEKWLVDGLPRLIVVASSDIKPHEELTYDYNFVFYSPEGIQVCNCGAAECRKTIGEVQYINFMFYSFKI